MKKNSCFRIFCLLASFIFLLNFSGCGTGPSDSSTITIWHWMTDRDASFQALAKQYEEQTGIKVDFELYAPSDAYSQKVRAAAQGSTLPDIFGILGEKRDFASFIKAGHILDLSSYMNESQGAWKNRFFKKALAVNEFSEQNSYGVTPGIYGVPIDIMTIQMVYNKDLLKKLGANPNKPPVNFDDFISLGTKIKENNLQGLVSGWGELWMVDCLANNYAFNIMGKDKVIATIKGEVPYTDPDWVKVFTLFQQMRESGILAEGIVTMVNKTAEQLFATEKAVFAFNGSWCVNVYKGMNPKLNYGAMLPPRAAQNYPVSIWGGAGSSFMVNARSAKKDAAIKFLKWLTDKEQQVYLADHTFNLPANKDSIGRIPEVMAQFADDVELSTHPNTWGVSEFPAVIETLDRGLQSIIIGEKTPQQVAAETQKVKEREMAKRR